MYDLLKGLRIVEGASFIAGPSCALHLAQLGAEVIRFDHIGGGPDFHRWPRAPEDGASFYWEGLNKGKKSIALDLRRPEGRELAVRLATATGDNAGLFVTNFPADGFLAHARLAERRPDLITLRVMGWADGTIALDYTVNSAIGYPNMTGPEDSERPVNHVLPAWDLLTGAHGALALMAAERHRRITGQGQEVRLPLGDVAMATVGHLGQIAEVTATGADRPRFGNAVFGAFGRDFVTADRRRVMIVAMTPGHWSGLIAALELTQPVAAMETELDVSFAHDEGVRFRHRDRLFPLVSQAVSRRSLAELATTFEAHRVCWAPYQSLKTALDGDPRLSDRNPLFTAIDQPSGHRYLTPGAAATFSGLERRAPRPAPRLGEHTDQVLAEILGLPAHEIGRLHDAGVVAGT